MSESPASAGLPRATVWGLPNWYLKVYRIFVVIILFLIALGGSVRVMNAGLACPDWPLCFDKVIPDYHPQVYFEFIHRVLAGCVSITLLVLQFLLLRSPRVPMRLKRVSVGTLLVLLAQVIMGGLTVRMQLSPPIVAGHLGLGTAFFALNVWIFQSLAFVPDQAAAPQPAVVIRQCVLMMIAAYLQILLGGMVAANYAANVCPGEFPTCYGQFFPTFNGQIGLQVMHRTWAYIVALLSVITYLFVLRLGSDVRLRKLSGMLIGVIVCQIALGITNVLLYTPPLIAVIHLAFATKILWLTVRMVHRARGVG